MSKKNPQNQPFFHNLPFKTTHFFFQISQKFTKQTKKKKKKKKKQAKWPELIPELVKLIDSGTENAVDGAYF
jgi:hypothetical protein